LKVGGMSLRFKWLPVAPVASGVPGASGVLGVPGATGSRSSGPGGVDEVPVQRPATAS
jgi:hypothetical protein